MSLQELTNLLGGWKGYQLGVCQRFEPGDKGPTAQLWLELLRDSTAPMFCSGCDQPVAQVHDVTARWVRDLPILEAQCHLRVHRRRVLCPRCGPKLEKLDWLNPYARNTLRLEESVARMCQLLPIKHVAGFYGLSWGAVKRIDKAWLQRTLGPPNMSKVDQIAMDEFAIQKGHRYATVIIEPHRRQVLWIGRGRGREDIRPFFKLFGEDGCKRLKAVAMDMNAAYELEVKAWCPNAAIIYDLFHVVVKYGREVIDRVRVDEANRLKDNKKARKVVKGSRWLLLRNRENIDNLDDRVRLRELLAANKQLATVYVLKDDLKHLWDYQYPGAAMRFWRGWYRRAMRSGIEPLKKFARNLKSYLPGIIAHCRWPLHTSVLEGINNKIKVIKRMAYGFRDDDYFFLKIQAAFPGKW